MSHDRLPPPQPEACLTLSRASRYKGGTLIAEDVWSVEEHVRRLSCPDGYRPEVCRRCGDARLHVHDHPERKPLGLAMLSVLRIVRFICVNPNCGATWRIVPAFLARHLWWIWRRVEKATAPTVAAATPPAMLPAKQPATVPTTTSVTPSAVPPTSPPATVSAPVAVDLDSVRPLRPRPVPERTRQRWLRRLKSSARRLVVLLATTGAAAVRAIAEGVSLDSTRLELVEAYAVGFGLAPGFRFASLAALVDRLERGIRFM
jgi:hypothetical protein